MSKAPCVRIFTRSSYCFLVEYLCGADHVMEIAEIPTYSYMYQFEAILFQIEGPQIIGKGLREIKETE